MIRMDIDQLGGTTYTFPNVTAFLANQPSAIQYAGDISAPSVFNNGATGPRHTPQQYYVAFAQDEWHADAEPDAELRPALRLLHAAEGAGQPDRQVQPRDRRRSIPNTTQLHGTKKDNFQPRVSMTYQRRAGPCSAAASASSSARARAKI